jgi:acetylornithine deacetylase/succinyl-diaminopimelate desuccinylase-like protein
VEALLATEGGLPVNVKFFFEAQEEIGSPQLPDFVAGHRDLLACDLVLSADGGQWSETEPALLIGLRGLCAVDVDLYGPSHDLHSGSYGGTVQNPLHAMATLMASLHDADGRVAVAGFYDDVRELSAEERAEIARVPMDEAAYMAELGVSELFGEAGYTPQERTWIRPTLEINGMWGGFQGEGSKTVLPAEAHVKITCRLVPNQDPARVAACIAAHLEAHRPIGTRLAVRLPEAGADAYEIAADHPGNQAAADVLRQLYGREPYQVRMGGTIPVTALFRRELGADTVIFAFGLVDELMHSPNEFFRLSAYRRGAAAYALILHRLAAGLE